MIYARSVPQREKSESPRSLMPQYATLVRLLRTANQEANRVLDPDSQPRRLYSRGRSWFVDGDSCRVSVLWPAEKFVKNFPRKPLTLGETVWHHLSVYFAADNDQNLVPSGVDGSLAYFSELQAVENLAVKPRLGQVVVVSFIRAKHSRYSPNAGRPGC